MPSSSVSDQQHGVMVEDVNDGNEDSVGIEESSLSRFSSSVLPKSPPPAPAATTTTTTATAASPYQQRFDDLGGTVHSLADASSVVSGISNATDFNPNTAGFNYNNNSLWNSSTGTNPFLQEAPDNSNKPYIPFRGGTIPTATINNTNTNNNNNNNNNGDTFEDEEGNTVVAGVVEDNNSNNNNTVNVDSGVFVNTSAVAATALDQNGNSLPHPDTIKMTQFSTIGGYNNPNKGTAAAGSANSIEDVDAANLGENGNSLPHPEALLNNNNNTTSTTTTNGGTATSFFLGTNQGNDVNDTLLCGNGNSLPHPEAIKKVSTTSTMVVQDDVLDVDAANLNENGNSLPHPETMNNNNKFRASSISKNQGNAVNDNLLVDNGSSLPHPETMKTLSSAPSTTTAIDANDVLDVDAANLDENGNSLPHPETMNNIKKFRASSISKNQGNDVNDNLLMDNGSSLPHPETMKTLSSTPSTIIVADDLMDVDAANLDENGNSLPHPETMNKNTAASSSAKDKGHDVDDTLLDDNGRSLPHPETLKRFGVAGAAAVVAGAGTAAVVATNAIDGRDVDAETGLFDNGNSLPHPDSLARFTPAVQAAAVANAIEDDYYFANDDFLADRDEGATNSSSPDDDDDDSSSSSADDEDDEDRLDENGNSLPHPETMFTSATNNNTNNTRSTTTTSRWGNLRNGVLSAFSTNRRSSDGTNNDANVSPFDVDDNSSNLAVNAADTAAVSAVLVQRDSNDNPLPPPDSLFVPSSGQNIATRQQQQQNRWQLLGRSVFSSLHTNAATPREEQDLFLDEEDGTNTSVNPTTNSTGLNNYNANNNNEESISFAYEVEPYNDNDDDSSRDVSSGLTTSSYKNNSNQRDGLLLTSYNGRYTWRCYLLIFAIFLIFLGVLIPLIALAVDRRNNEQQIPSENDNNINIIAAPPPSPIIVVIAPQLPTAAPTFPPIAIIDENRPCKDEFAFLDKNGNVIDDEDELCFTTTESIQLQYTYCNPTSVGDWMGLFPSRSMFMDRLYKSYVFGKVLECLDDDTTSESGGGTNVVDGVELQPQRPCTVDDLGQPQVNVQEVSPLITEPGEYRFFVVKNSYWPHQYVTYTPTFRVVIDAESCKNDDNIFIDLPVSSQDDDAPTLDDYENDEDDDDIGEDDDVGNFLGNLIGGVTGNNDDDFGDQVGDQFEDFVDGIGDFIDGIFVGDGNDPTTDTGINNVFENNDPTAAPIFPFN